MEGSGLAVTNGGSFGALNGKSTAWPEEKGGLWCDLDEAWRALRVALQHEVHDEHVDTIIVLDHKSVRDDVGANGGHELAS